MLKFFSNPLAVVGLGIVGLAIAMSMVLFYVQFKMELNYQLIKSHDYSELISTDINIKINKSVDIATRIAKQIILKESLNADINDNNIENMLQESLKRENLVDSISIMSSQGELSYIEASKSNYESDDTEDLSELQRLDNNDESYIKLSNHKIKNQISIIIRVPIKLDSSSANGVYDFIEIDTPLRSHYFEKLSDNYSSIIITNNNGNEIKVIGDIDEEKKHFALISYLKEKRSPKVRGQAVSTIVMKKNIFPDYKIIINGINIADQISLIYTTSYNTDSTDVISLIYHTISFLVIFVVFLILYLRYSLKIHIKIINNGFAKSMNAIANESFRAIENKSWQNSSERNVNNAINSLGALIDFERKKCHLLLKKDEVTGVLNRRSGFDECDNLILDSKQINGTFSIFHINIQDFNSVNDLIGRDGGDIVLVGIANRLNNIGMEVNSSVSHKNYILFRLNADEFTLVLNNVYNNIDIERLSNSIISAINLPFFIDENRFTLNAQIGVAVYPRDGESTSELTKKADLAVNVSRSSKDNGYTIFNSEIAAKLDRFNFIKSEMKVAMEHNDFEVVYQPQFTVKGRRIIGVESLLRWRHPEAGLIMPNEFIPIAEATGQIKNLGFWVMRNACVQNKAWQKTGFKPIKVAVIVSIQQLCSYGFVQQVNYCLDKSGMEAKYLDLEINESIFMDIGDAEINALNELRRMGVTISIDHFGMGKSSLSRLRDLPLSKIKIDRSFAFNIAKNERDLAVIKSMITTGKAFGLEILVEGIEREAQFKILKDLECDQVQGYMLSYPVPAHKIPSYFKANMARVYDINSNTRGS